VIIRYDELFAVFMAGEMSGFADGEYDRKIML
jgi:hypothetical protein